MTWVESTSLKLIVLIDMYRYCTILQSYTLKFNIIYINSVMNDY